MIILFKYGINFINHVYRHFSTVDTILLSDFILLSHREISYKRKSVNNSPFQLSTNENISTDKPDNKAAQLTRTAAKV